MSDPSPIGRGRTQAKGLSRGEGLHAQLRDPKPLIRHAARATFSFWEKEKSHLTLIA